MTKYIVANFKQNFDLKQLDSWLKDFLTHFSATPDKQVIIAGTYLHLPTLLARQMNFSISAQTVSPFDQGAHTGSVGARELKGLVTYCLVGHSETRLESGITDKQVAKAAKLLVGHGITPIICVDTPYLESQINVLKTELLSLKDLFFAYEPLSAIGSGHPDTPENANQVAFKIKTLTSKSFPVIYGGSVNAENVRGFTTQEFIDGVLVGRESLDPISFQKIIDNV